MTTRELFNRWFRNKKKVPVFNEDVDVVCKASQIVTEDGKNIEDKLKEGVGGSKALPLHLIDNPIYNEQLNGYLYDIIDNTIPTPDYPGTIKGQNDTKWGPDPAAGTVYKSELDAIINTGLFCQVCIFMVGQFKGVGVLYSIGNYTIDEGDELHTAYNIKGYINTIDKELSSIEITFSFGENKLIVL